MAESWLFKKRAKAREADGAVSHEEPGHRIPSDDEGVNATTRYRPRRQHTLKEAMAKSIDDFLAKGDVAGHDFHGNQYTGGSGAGSINEHMASVHGKDYSGFSHESALTQHAKDHKEGRFKPVGLSPKDGIGSKDMIKPSRGIITGKHDDVLRDAGWNKASGGSSNQPKGADIWSHPDKGDQRIVVYGDGSWKRSTSDDPFGSAKGKGTQSLAEHLSTDKSAMITKDWGTATPQGSTMPATGLQGTNLGPGQKKRCPTCGKVKCKCR